MTVIVAKGKGFDGLDAGLYPCMDRRWGLLSEQELTISFRRVFVVVGSLAHAGVVLTSSRIEKCAFKAILTCFSRPYCRDYQARTSGVSVVRIMLIPIWDLT